MAQNYNLGPKPRPIETKSTPINFSQLDDSIWLTLGIKSKYRSNSQFNYTVRFSY